MKPKKQRVLKIGEFIVDAFITESPSRTASTTKFPIERGSDVTDHTKLEPLSLEVEGIVSDSPIGALAQARELATSVTAAATFNDAEDMPSYSEQAREYFIRVRDARQPITVETSRETHRNMIIVDLQMPRDASVGHACRFEITFEQITIIDNARVKLRADRRTRGPRRYGAKLSKNGTFTENGITYYAFGAAPIIWRKGVPPGAPLKPGYRSEVIYYAMDPKQQRGYFTRNVAVGGARSSDPRKDVLPTSIKRVPLTPDEKAAFDKDMARDGREKQATRAIVGIAKDTAKLFEPTVKPKFTPAPSKGVFSREALNPNQSLAPVRPPWE